MKKIILFSLMMCISIVCNAYHTEKQQIIYEGKTYLKITVKSDAESIFIYEKTGKETYDTQYSGKIKQFDEDKYYATNRNFRLLTTDNEIKERIHGFFTAAELEKLKNTKLRFETSYRPGGSQIYFGVSFQNMDKSFNLSDERLVEFYLLMLNTLKFYMPNNKYNIPAFYFSVPTFPLANISLSNPLIHPAAYHGYIGSAPW